MSDDKKQGTGGRGKQRPKRNDSKTPQTGGRGKQRES